MKESLHGEFRVSSLEHRRHRLRAVARHPETAWAKSFSAFDAAAQRGSPRWAPPFVVLTERAPRRAGTGRMAALIVAIRRIVAAIRLWRERARSRQQLRELNDRMLRDIGLRREEVGYQFPKPFWHRD
jgi:uncharacterized protein YjiS (DUF1127 family)